MRASLRSDYKVPDKIGIRCRIDRNTHGRFTMGDKQGEIDEKPHEVYMDSFFVDKCLVTQEEYKKVMGENTARWKGKKNPI